MPSVLEQKFKHTIYLKNQYRRDIERYCISEIGYRTYYLQQFFGGKTWQIYNQPKADGTIQVNLNDDGHATILSLKYAG